MAKIQKNNYGWLNKSTTELGKKVDQIFNKQWIKKL